MLNKMEVTQNTPLSDLVVAQSEILWNECIAKRKISNTLLKEHCQKLWDNYIKMRNKARQIWLISHNTKKLSKFARNDAILKADEDTAKALELYFSASDLFENEVTVRDAVEYCRIASDSLSALATHDIKYLDRLQRNSILGKFSPLFLVKDEKKDPIPTDEVERYEDKHGV